MNDWMIGIVIALCGYFAGLLSGYTATTSGLEKKCIYENRVEFSGQMFSCQWLPGVEEKSEAYGRKPYPNKEVLK